jgi:hypothetical protein
VSTPEPAKCKSCGAPVEWVLTEKGKWMPVDFQRALTGNILLSQRAVGQPATAIYQSAEEIETLKRQAQARGEAWQGLFVSHFATCPSAAKHRKRK